MAERERRGDWVLPFSMFFGTFAWSFVFVSLPFYILGGIPREARS